MLGGPKGSVITNEIDSRRYERMKSLEILAEKILIQD